MYVKLFSLLPGLDIKDSTLLDVELKSFDIKKISLILGLDVKQNQMSCPIKYYVAHFDLTQKLL